MKRSKLLRMDNIGIVVEDIKGAIAFFVELGMKLEGEMTVEGSWVDRVVGLEGVRNDIAMLRTPDGNGRLELMKFRNPTAIRTDKHVPVNTFGIRRIMFAVRNLDDVAASLRKRGAEPVGEVLAFQNADGVGYRLFYLRGPEGIMIALAEQTGNKSATDDGKSSGSSLIRMDNVLIVVDDLERTKAFFTELGLDYQGETQVEGADVDSLIGLKGTRATLALMRTPDGHMGIELDKYHAPPAVGFESMHAPVNTMGIRRLMFAVDDIDEVVARLTGGDAELVGEVAQYEDMYRLCYVRGPEGLIIGLAQELG